jgi:acetolactate synthase-1/3 small subunit
MISSAEKPSFLRTFIVDVEDRPGALNRVVSLFRRRNYNIDSLSVATTERSGTSRITLVVRADVDTAQRIQANLYKLVNVLYVRDITDGPSVVRELAFIKVKANREQRGEVLRLCALFRARIIDIRSKSMTIEITGVRDKVYRLIAVLRPYGILELLRGGAVGMVCDSDEQTTQEDPIGKGSSDEAAA